LRILDRYIVSSFLKVLLFSLLTFWLISILVNIIDNIDTYIDKRALLFSILKYYLFSTPYTLILTLPMAMLLASLFSLGHLSGSNQLTPMRTAGLSLHRILFPLFISSFLISLFALSFGEFVVPPANSKMEYVKRVEIKNKPRRRVGVVKDLYFQGEDGRVFYFHRWDAQKGKGDGVSIQIYRGDGLISRIDASQMWWEDGVWVLKDGYRRRFAQEGEQVNRFTDLKLTIREKPSDFSRPQKDPQEMDFFKLRDYIRKARRGGKEVARELVDLNLKFSFPLANFIILLFGAPIACRKRRSGMAVNVATSLGITFVYYGFLRVGQTMGYNGSLSPFWAAWLGNLLFGGAGLLLLWWGRR